MGGLRPQIQSIVLLSNVALFVASIRRVKFPNGPIRVQGAYRHEQGVAVGGSLEERRGLRRHLLGEEPACSRELESREEDRSHESNLSSNISDSLVVAGWAVLTGNLMPPQFQPNAPSRFPTAAVPPIFNQTGSLRKQSAGRSRTRSGGDREEPFLYRQAVAREFGISAAPSDAAPPAAIESAAR